jgi:hypothetical protein
VSLNPRNEKGALDAMSGRVVCIGMLIDDGQNVNEITLADGDERQLIAEFWRTIALGAGYLEYLKALRVSSRLCFGRWPILKGSAFLLETCLNHY